MEDRTVCIIGLGYVGLPLAEAFSKHLKVIGFDIDEEKTREQNGDNSEDNIEFTSDPARIREADFGFCFDLRSHASDKIEGAGFEIC
jgi:UDPglucose 6-dehydrogenase/UDP-N-acetyl-D-galactosamine dehydrogenase